MGGFGDTPRTLVPVLIQNIEAPRVGSHGFGPQDACVFCRARGSFRTREHIIPKAIGGTFTVPSATCRTCQVSLHKLETELLSGALRNYRLKFGFPTKTYKKSDIIGTKVRKGDDTPSIEHYSRSMLMAPMIQMFVPPPFAIFGRPETEKFVYIWQHFRDFRHPRNTVFTFGPLRAESYFQIIVKMAHAYSVATFGADGFLWLAGHCVTDPDLEPFQWAGCLQAAVDKFPPAEPGTLHRMSFQTWRTPHKLYLVVEIRLFAHLGGPVYSVVTGELAGPPSTESVRSLRSTIISTRSRK